MKVMVGKSEDFPEGEMRTVDIDWERILVVRIEGVLFAIDDACSHAEASLSKGERQGHEVRCPLHGARFDLRSGSALSLPAAAPVESYEVLEEAGEVFVRQ